MKKYILGLFALSSVSLALSSGNIDVNADIIYNKEENSHYGFDTKSKIEFFLGENKDLYAFSKINFLKENISDINLSKENLNLLHIGTSFDTEISDNFSLSGIVGYKVFDKKETLKNSSKEISEYKDKNVFKDYLIYHLKEKGKYFEDDSYFKKENALRHAGYVNDENKDLIVGMTSAFKISDTKINLGSTYLTKNFENNTNKVVSFFDTDTRLNIGYFETKLLHEYDDFNEVKASDIFYKISKYKDVKGKKAEVRDKKLNLSDYLGTLKGSFRFSSSKLIPNTYFANEFKYDLKSGILKVDNSDRAFRTEFKNYLKYTGIENLEIIARGEYQIDGNLINLDENASAAMKKDLEGDTNLKHSLDLNVETKYSENGHKLDSVIKSVSEISSQFNNNNKLVQIFEMKNKGAYAISDELSILGDLNYKAYINAFGISDDYLIGTGFNYKGRKDNMIYDLNTQFKYKYNTVFDLSFKNSIDKANLVFNEMKLSQLFDKLKLDYNFNLYSEVSNRNHLAKTKKDKDINYKQSLIYVNPGIKVSYNLDNLNLSSSLQYLYNKDKIVDESEAKSNKIIEKNEDRYLILSENELKYTINDNLDWINGINIEYNYNQFSNDELKTFKDYLENGGYDYNRYYQFKDIKGEYTYNKNKGKFKDGFEINEVKTANQELKLTPIIKFKMKYDNLVLIPKAELDIIYKANKGEKLKYNNYVAKFGINAIYNW